MRKKRVHEIDRARLSAILLTTDQQKKFDEGCALFNEGKYWESHEMWEDVWRERSEEGRIFFQGIIQAAAAYHLLFVRPRLSGARRNFAKALTILDLFPARYLGVDVASLRRSVQETAESLVDGTITHLDRPRPKIIRMG